MRRIRYQRLRVPSAAPILMADDNDERETWFGGIVRSLTCAGPRKPPARSDLMPQLTHAPVVRYPAPHLPITSADALLVMQRRAAELDREIADLRRSIGTPTVPAPAPVTPASTMRRRADDVAAPHWATPSTPPPLSERASGVMEELSRGLKCVVARARTPGGSYSEIGMSSRPLGKGIMPSPLPSNEQDAMRREREARRRW